MARPVVGSMAPDFTLLTDAGVPLALSSLRGQTVILFFYPKDDTPTCTKEACEFRDAFPRFDASRAVVLGVSPDSVKSHVKFRKKFNLPYALLADPDNTVCEAYGVWAGKSLWGHRYMGVERTTFVIGPSGRIASVFEKVRAVGHAGQVMSAIAAAT